MNDCVTNPNQLIISRTEAMAKGMKVFFTGNPCVHGHIALRHVSSRGCVECARILNTKYRKSNIERARSNYRKSAAIEYAKDPQKCNKGTIKWRKINRSDYLDSTKRTYQKQKATNPKIRVLQSARNRARLFDLPYDLTEQDIDIPLTCPMLGIPLDRRTRDYSPSLDRIVPSKGYVKGNVLVVSCRANTIKNNATPEELRKIADFVSTVWKE